MGKGFKHGTGAKLRTVPSLQDTYPEDVTVDGVGTVVSFDIIIAEPGYPTSYTYQWYYDGSAVPGATGTTYTREAEFGEHEVFCVLTNVAGSVFSRTAKVTATTEYLYKTGTIYPIAGDFRMNQGKNYIEKQAGQLYMRTTGHNVWDDCYFTNLIDLTPYNTLYMVGSVSITGSGDWWGQFEFGAYTQLTGSLIAGITGAKAQGTYPIDVSKLSGKYYINFCMKGFANYASALVQQVYLK